MKDQKKGEWGEYEKKALKKQSTSKTLIASFQFLKVQKYEASIHSQYVTAVGCNRDAYKKTAGNKLKPHAGVNTVSSSNSSKSLTTKKESEHVIPANLNGLVFFLLF